ncbi:MAG: efflux RND transporter periplasmic adaptor subunit [Chitinispirillaceae bacterium]|nr:efflux RND transporter periplasmic adaptor subunit [Chitinispirillaceae bacterium]
MKKKTIIIILILIAAACGTYFFFAGKATLQKTEYKTVEITRGSIQNVISSTGSLNPVSTVEVGTQVSGTIVKVTADYNDIVTRDQIIAEIDKEPLINKLNQVKASFMRSEAQYKQSESKYKRNIPLHEKGLISDDEFMSIETDYLSQKAALEGAKADIETARNNLSYAIIRSPVNGTVISRSVEVGQTVAASFSAPVLFIIAEDLQQMEILADVDESDIGKIRQDQEVSFTVPAYPERNFSGVVSQIRLQPVTSQSVVTYTVVIKASNVDGILFPGMTANVDFITEKVDDVLTVPSMTLRFKPSDDQLAKLRQMRQNQKMGDRGKRDSGSVSNSPARSTQNVKNNGSQSESGRGVLWILDDNGDLRPEFVKTGLTDGSSVEIQGRSVKEGMLVVSGVIDKSKKKKQTASRSLFAPQRMPGGTSGRRSSGGGVAPRGGS